MSALQVEVPAKLAPLLQPKRYKGAYGGRGGAKSHFFAEQVVLRCLSQFTRAVCIREVQESIKDSVKTLIESKIQKLGLGKLFDCLETEIRGPHGSLIIFRGMQSYNAENIKSLEAFDIAWVEEAQTLSDISWRLLRPTIRKEGSEIWCSWNPRHDTDAVDKFFRGTFKNPEAVAVEINWPDNPWFPEVLRKEKDSDYASDPEMADHVWGGGYLIVSEGAYYAKQVLAAEREGRIGNFPYKAGQKVRTSWDLGIDDYTAVWFWVGDGFKETVVDYYEASGDGFDDIVSTMFPEVFIPPPGEDKFIGWSREKALKDIGREIPFVYEESFLPHDVKVREQGSSGRHRYEILQRLGIKNIRKGVATNPEERVAAGRKLFPNVRFHLNERTAVGIKRLRRYSRKFNEALGKYAGPLKDGNDHGADAFGEYAVNCSVSSPKIILPPKPTELVFEAKPDGTLTSNMSIREIIELRKRKKAANE